MPKAYRTDREKYESIINEAKKGYFYELLRPYLKDGILDTKSLHRQNAHLYEEFRLAFKGIRAGCQAIGIHPSAAALRAKVGPLRKQIRTLAQAYLEEHGLEAAAAKIGIGIEGIKRLQENLLAPPTARKRAARARPKKKTNKA